jgi:predicted DNA-binding transcriptional regulator AlpA
MEGTRERFLTYRQICHRLGNPKLYHTIRRKYKHHPRAVRIGSGKKNWYVVIPESVIREDFGV